MGKTKLFCKINAQFFAFFSAGADNSAKQLYRFHGTEMFYKQNLNFTQLFFRFIFKKNFFKENEQTSWLEILTEYSARRQKYHGSFQEMKLKSSPFKK